MRAQITTSALMSCEPSTQAHVVIHARMSDLLWAQGPKNNKELYCYYCYLKPIVHT